MESLAREAIGRGEILEDARVWRAWFQAALVDLRLAPAEALAGLPRDPRAGDSAGAAGEYRWLLGALASGGALRIDCGSELDGVEGRSWSRDRFFRAGSTTPRVCLAGQEAAPSGATIYCTERVFPGQGFLRAGYLIPLPPGRYRVALHFRERSNRVPDGRVFSILLEGRTAIEGHEPLDAGFDVPDVRSFDLEVIDGALELDFVAHRGTPSIAAIEIEAAGS
jgi:hypothetical protein